MSTITIKSYSLIGTQSIAIYPYEELERITIDYKPTPDFSFIFLLFDNTSEHFAIPNEMIDDIIDELNKLNKNTSITLSIPASKGCESRRQLDEFNEKLDEKRHELFSEYAKSKSKSKSKEEIEEEIAEWFSFLEKLEKSLGV